MLPNWYWLVLLLLGLVWLVWTWPHGSSSPPHCAAVTARGERLLKPRTPDDCLSGKLNTAFVERVNLTLRQSVAALIRRTWSTVQEAPHLLLHLEWWRAYYHFVRPHQSLRVELGQAVERGGKRLPQRYRQRTPAMAAGLTSRRWTVREVLTMPLPPEPMGAG